MKQMIKTGLCCLCVISLTACNATKQDIGTVVGAGSGALIGSQIGGGKGQLAAVAIGTLVGGYVGGNIGRNMDELDRYRTSTALENSPTGRTVAWRNPDSGIDYQVTPTRTYNNSRGPCREYTTEAIIDGRPEILHGTACREANGNWVAMN